MIGDPAGASRQYLRRSEAARYVEEKWRQPCKTKTLAKLAVTGGGPEFTKAGRFPLYEPSDLDSWCKSRLGPKQRSTSDPGFQLSENSAQSRRGEDRQAPRDGRATDPMPRPASEVGARQDRSLNPSRLRR
jgi:hypothetical protein